MVVQQLDERRLRRKKVTSVAELFAFGAEATMRVITRILGCLSFWLSLTTVTLHGQPGIPRLDSLQWVVASSDLIVRGTIDSISPLNPGDKYCSYYEVSVTVRETLLGASSDHIRFVASSGEVDPIKKLKASGDVGLLFFVSSRKDFNRQTNDYFYTRHQVVLRKVFDLSVQSPQVVSLGKSGIKQIRDGNSILNEVRTCSRRRQVGERTRHLEVEAGGPEIILRDGSNYKVDVRVPADRYLWTILQQWSRPEGMKVRNGRDITSAFVQVLDYEQIRAKYAAARQVATPARPINSLHIDSIEWMTADSDLITRGTIDDVVLLKLADPKSGNDYFSTIDIHVVKLRVAEALKGEASGLVTFLVENGGDLVKWQQQKTPLLTFLKDNMIQGIAPPVRLRSELDPSEFDVLRYSGRGPANAAIVAFEKPQPKILSMDLKWLDDPEEILRTVRRYLREVTNTPDNRVGSVASFSFQPRRSFTSGTAWQENAYARIYFPIDAYLEMQARQWIKSGEKEHRWVGVAALAYFKTDENAAILEGVLNDPGQWPTPVPVSIYSDLKVQYLVRWEAWTILNAWGYHAARPVLSN
jgi:hypothetical protein